jgi:hypothetical protein
MAAATAEKSAPTKAAHKKDEPPKTTPEQDLALFKTVLEVTATETVTRVCQSLKWNVDNKDLAVAACQALAALARDNTKKQLLIQARGGLTNIVSAMKRHATELKLQEEAMSTLIVLCDGNDSNANAVAKLAIPVLLDLLKLEEKKTTQDFVHHTVYCMDVVCAAASGRKEAAQRAVVDVIMDLMTKYKLNVKIHERGAGVLRHIASDAGGKKAINAKGGVEILKASMKLFPNSGLLEENATEAIKRLSH